jgi:hypothetical protein
MPNYTNKLAGRSRLAYRRGFFPMPKALALTGLVVSVLILILMLVDLAWTRASLAMDIGFILCALGLGVLSYLTFREQS